MRNNKILNQDFEVISSYLKSQNISIDFEEFKFQVESHPDYPSLLAFSDALTFFNIPNVATKIEKQDIEILPDFFVALLSEPQKEHYLSFVQIKNGFYLYSKEKETRRATLEELQKNWSDVILLVEKPETFIENINDKSILKPIIIFGLYFTTLLFIFCFSQSMFAMFFVIITFLGIYFSIEALKTELGIESKVSNAFCNVISNADCEQVINSEKNIWLKIFKISNVSIWFFSSQLFLLFLFSVFGNTPIYFSYLLVVLVLSIPMTLYSIYFQYKIEKKWCPICLTIIGLVYLQLAILLFNHYEITFEIKSLFLFLFSFLLTAIAIYFIKPLFLELKDLKEKNLKNLRFKRNYFLFKNSLIKMEQQIFENQFIILGNPDAKLKISIITSPLCGHCKVAHDVLHHILDKHRENIAINIRFNFDENSNEKNNQFFYRLVEIYQKSGDLEFSKALKNYFETKNIDNWLKHYGNSTNDDEIKEQLLKVSAENKTKELNFTPNIIINQYQFPNQYEISDLEYFVTDLIDDEEL